KMKPVSLLKQSIPESQMIMRTSRSPLSTNLDINRYNSKFQDQVRQFWAKNRDLVRSRPLSPHLKIYKQPLNAIFSITHRISGVYTYG
ncbi:MAG: hypothetical protein MHMPM18_004851, partial [Marteilia pararefringens]